MLMKRKRKKFKPKSKLMQLAQRKEEASAGRLPKSTAWRVAWGGWKIPAEHRQNKYFNPVFDTAMPPKLDVVPGVTPNFIAFILFNPSAELAADLEEMCAIWDSWVRPGVIELYVAIPIEASADVTLPANSKVKILVVPEKEAYPPVKLELAMWKQAYIDLHEQFGEKTFVIKLDMDTYFNPDALLKVIDTFSTTDADYIGSLGYGRHNEYKEKPYCVGFSYYVRAKAIKAFENPRPLADFVVNSDVAVGYVIDAKCRPLPDGQDKLLIHNYFSIDAGGAVVARQLSGEGFGDSKQTLLPMFPAPPTGMLQAIAVHPIKLTTEFTRFHQQVKLSLRPPLWSADSVMPSEAVDETDSGYKRFMQRYSSWMDNACVANVADQVSRMQDILPPCYYRQSTAAEFPLTSVYIPTFHPEKVEQYLRPLVQPMGMKVVAFPALRGDAKVARRGDKNVPEVTPEAGVINDEYRNLTMGEIGYRRSMEGIMRKFLEESDEPLLFICDDDVRFHINFERLYAALDSYCLDGLASGVGILKLQTAIWHSGTFTLKEGSTTTINYEQTLTKSAMYIGGWNLIDYEMSMTGSKCYSGHYATMGSAATIYTRASIPFVLRWLEEREVLPYDHIFSHLAHLGIPIRVTEPNLAIMEMDKTSSVDDHRNKGNTDRSEYVRRVFALHRWQSSNYHPSIYQR